MIRIAEIDLDTPYSLPADAISKFRDAGFIKLKDVFSPEELDHFRPGLTDVVLDKARDKGPLEQRDTYGKAFLQVTNLWEESALARQFVFGKRLARIATELLGTKGVRLYHDQALYKESGGGYTPWHVDQVYWPASSELTVTAWVPLSAVPLDKGPLSFAIGSHKLTTHRNLTISDESEKQIDRAMKLGDFPIDETPYDLGEISFHYGYTFHRAGPNRLEQPREVMTVIYLDSKMVMSEPRNKNQESDARRWCPGVKPGELIDSRLNPVLYST